jgi:hypothetical protein
MKTSKSMSESGKRGKAKDSVKNRKIIINESGPTEEEIREKANELYLQRIERGEDGTAENDWAEAERYFNNIEA